MKALSLPINAVVIIVIAVLIFLAVGAMFMSGSARNISSISDSEALLNGCASWRERGCSADEQLSDIKIPGYDSQRSIGYKGTLKEACIAALLSSKFDENAAVIKETCFAYCCAR